MATSIGLLATEIAATNTWWRSASWTAEDPDLLAAARLDLAYRTDCLAGLKPGGLYMLRGPRRVGKTVAVKQAIEDLIADGVPPRAIVRIAADGLGAKDLRTITQNTALPRLAPEQQRWWFFDEITGTTGDWAAQIKWLRDNDLDFSRATVVLTGSDATGLTVAAGQLAGRRGPVDQTDRTLMPMGFRTFTSRLDAQVDLPEHLSLAELRTPNAQRAYDQALPWLDLLSRCWELYLSYGGFPVAVAAARAGDPMPAWFLDDMFNVVFKDAFASSRLSEIATGALLARLMQSMGSPLNLRTVGRDVDVEGPVVARHVDYLRAAYLTWTAPQKADSSWTPLERGHGKLYAIDPVIARLCHLRNPARSDVDPTILTEMQLGMMLRRAAYASGCGWTADDLFFHVRTPTRKEIDFVGEPLAGVALEGKYTDRGTWRSEAATVNASAYDGLLVTRSVLDVESADGSWAVPAGILAYLVDT
jgi:uncharacterized protein